MLRRLLTVLGLVFFLAMPAAAEISQPLTLFPTEQEAQKHCPADVVVWLNLAIERRSTAKSPCLTSEPWGQQQSWW
jgi:hypothetical protein